MNENATETVVRQSFAAFGARDRALIERTIAPDFHFTSPYDSRIDRETYFERCWANADKIRDIVIERLFARGDEAFVRYRVETVDGARFHNAEFHRVRDGQLVEVEVYFGEVPGVAPRP